MSRMPKSASSGDPLSSSVVLLAGFEGTDGSTTLVDESSVARTLTAQSTAQIDTAQFKYGASSLLLNGTSDYVTAPDSTDFEFGSGEFTIEMFVRMSSTPSDAMIVCHRDSAGNGWRFGREGTALLFTSNGYTFGGTSGAWSPTIGQWYHLCVDRDASQNTRIYVDGAMRTKSTSTASIAAATEVFAIGRLGHVALWYFPGHIDELRITKGTGRYASDSGFTVPTSAYPRG